MSRSRRFLLFTVIGSVALLILVAAGLLLFVDANVFKGRLEAAASEELGMEFSVVGRLGIGFFPGVRVTLEDVHIRNRGLEVASAKEATLAIDLLPLLSKEVRIEKIALKSARIVIESDRQGLFNFERPQQDRSPLPVLDWPNVSLVDTTVVYADQQSGHAFEASDCHAAVNRLRLAGGERANLMKALSFTAELACAALRARGFSVSNLKSSVDAKNGVFELEPITTRVLGTQGSGTVRADFSGAVPVFQVRYALSQFPIEEFFKTLSQKNVAAGRMDFSADLSMQGKTGHEWQQTLKGHISLRGRNLTLIGSDLDRDLSRFESSQNFNLVDVGAFFIAGPLGLVVTKGYSFATILQGTGGSSEIQTLVSEWKVQGGVAHAQDVAMATRKNRIALQGGLDFVNDTFDDVTVAVIDAKGCATVRQKIRGTFKNPVVEKPNFLASLAGPALRLLKKGSELLGAHCDVFYAGSVAAPK
jgi:AsmA protein